MGKTFGNQEVIHMLLSRRNHGNKGLLQDATRASSRVAEQAQQTLSGIADESRGLAQTARTEIGDLSREMRDQASGKVHRVRRRTAKKLSKAADAVEPSPKRKGRPIVKAALAAVAGWVLVNVARKARQKDDESTSTTSDTGDKAETVKSEAADVASKAKAAAKEAADKAKAAAKAAAEKAKTKVSADEGPAQRHTSEAAPAGTSTTRSNASSK
jgi:hypothetical protein